jgi:pimeloyl-ACP methyl ester carboxylesterase
MTKDKSPKSYDTTYANLFDYDSSTDGESNPLLSEELLDQQRQFFTDNKNNFADLHEKSKVQIELGETAFQASLVKGDANEAIVIGGEYGNANSIQAFVRALTIRESLNPDASLLFLPNNTLRENNLQLNHDERQHLHAGNAKPLTDRYMKGLDSLGDTDNPINIVGMSLGASTGMALAADKNLDLRSATLIESPHLRESSPLKAGKDFLTSGGDLADNIKMSQLEVEGFHATDLDGLVGFARFGVGALTPTNLATLNFMRHRNMENDIKRARSRNEKMGLVAVWGTEANVSPSSVNQRIAADNSYDPRMKFFEIEGMDHSGTNAMSIVAGAARYARSLGLKR